ncbi:MAG: NosD domain-containing protein [Gammaproteobacteria bacterium]
MSGVPRASSTDLRGSARVCLFACVVAVSFAAHFVGPAHASPPSFQALVDAAEPNSTLEPEAGVYAGPVVITKPLTIDGKGWVTLDAGGKGSVVVIKSDGVTLKGLRLTNSGESHNDIDAGVQVRGRFNVIKDNVIDNTLFGIDLQQSENNVVRRNHIRSKEREIGLRGDAIRLWYSFDNKITDNVIRDSRDMVVWYSADNVIARNQSSGGRYSLHFMYSNQNEVTDNRFVGNQVGIFVMYSQGMVFRNNFIAHATGATGVGIGFKESSRLLLEDNQVLYCATGLYLDVSPYEPETTNLFRNNLLGFNGIAVRFLSDWWGNVFENNIFKGNLTQVVAGSGGTATRNIWKGNYWDDYEGFDQDRDGLGDGPYELYAYADRVWMDVPPTQFFKGAPILEVLDFMERLAPFTEPRLMLRDSEPRIAVN